MKKGTIRGSPMELSKWWQEPGEKETSPKAPKNPEDLGKFIVDDPLTFHLQHTPKEWAAGMRETKICVFDSSAERKTIRKFNEAFLSGCVVASDIPHEMEHVFRGVVIELSDSMSESEIDKILGDALADPERLAEMALEAHKRARVYFNCRNKVDKLLQVASKYMDGEKGYWFPDGYSAVCRSYSTDPKKKFAPAWC